MGYSIPHLVVVLGIVVLVFGTKRLRNVGSDLGYAIKGFRSSVKEAEDLDRVIATQGGNVLEDELVIKQADKV